MTNYDRIAKSPRALAEYLTKDDVGKHTVDEYDVNYYEDTFTFEVEKMFSVTCEMLTGDITRDVEIWLNSESR